MYTDNKEQDYQDHLKRKGADDDTHEYFEDEQTEEYATPEDMERYINKNK